MYTRLEWLKIWWIPNRLHFSMNQKHFMWSFLHWWVYQADIFWQKIPTASLKTFLFITGIKFQYKNWNSYMKLAPKLYWKIIFEKLEQLTNYQYIVSISHNIFKFTKELRNILFQINSSETLLRTYSKETCLIKQWLFINIWSWRVHSKCKLFTVTWEWSMKDKRTYLKLSIAT